jgi:hypothetical protein
MVVFCMHRRGGAILSPPERRALSARQATGGGWSCWARQGERLKSPLQILLLSSLALRLHSEPTLGLS